MDRRFDPGLPVHLPADVDLQAGVRRVRSRNRPPQVLLSAEQRNTKIHIVLYCYLRFTTVLLPSPLRPRLHCQQTTDYARPQRTRIDNVNTIYYY